MAALTETDPWLPEHIVHCESEDGAAAAADVVAVNCETDDTAGPGPEAVCVSEPEGREGAAACGQDPAAEEEQIASAPEEEQDASAAAAEAPMEEEPKQEPLKEELLKEEHPKEEEPKEEEPTEAEPTEADVDSPDTTSVPTEKPVSNNGEISNAASAVRVYDGLPKHGLTQEQIEELFAEVQGMKSKGSNSNYFKFGWQLIYTTRAPGSSTRGDMCVIDPRDGQKIFSLIGMRRKLGIAGPMEMPALLPRVRVERPPEDPDALAARALLLAEVREPRRSRTAVNYAEKAGEPRARPQEHIGAVLAEAGDEGVDLVALADKVHSRTGGDEETPLPIAAVRQTLMHMLRAGRARRRLNVAPPVKPGDSESALRLLVLHTMQIEPDRAAPWNLEVLEGSGDGTRLHVWKGVTLHHLPHVRGRRLVGRRIEIWWDGDVCFYPATVRHYASTDGEWGHDCGKGMFIVEYADGLRAIEDLEGPFSEPQQWRLVDADDHPEDADEHPEDADGGGEDEAGPSGVSNMEVEGAASSSHGAEADEAEEGVADAWGMGDLQPKVEALVSIAAIRSQLPTTGDEALLYHAPPGWADEPTGEEGGRPRPQWVQRSADGEVVRKVRTRAEVEDLVEAEAAEAGRPWLGQLVGGRWEIRPRHVQAALTHVLDGLVDEGHISVLSPERTGRSMVLYITRNRYTKGEPFPQQKRKREAAPPEPEEELSEFELQRQRNIARNQELLKQLGLA